MSEGNDEQGAVASAKVDPVRGLLIGRARLLMVIAGAAVALLVLGSELLDHGEVVKLTITDARGRAHETNLWIVDLDGGSYLRAASPDAHWLASLRVHPIVTVVRDERTATFLAVPADGAETADRVARAMAEKYGLADRLWEWVSDRSQAVAIRLELQPEDEGAEPGVRRDPH